MESTDVKIKRYSLQNKYKDRTYSISNFGNSEYSGGRCPDKLLLSSRLQKTLYYCQERVLNRITLINT